MSHIPFISEVSEQMVEDEVAATEGYTLKLHKKIVAAIPSLQWMLSR